MDSNQKTSNKKLFVNKNGTMIFNLCDLDLKQNVANMIKEHGGIVLPRMKAISIKTVYHIGIKGHRYDDMGEDVTVIDIKWLYDCISSNTVVDPSPYKIDKLGLDKEKVHGNTPKKSTGVLESAKLPQNAEQTPKQTKNRVKQEDSHTPLKTKNTPSAPPTKTQAPNLQDPETGNGAVVVLTNQKEKPSDHKKDNLLKIYTDEELMKILEEASKDSQFFNELSLSSKKKELLEHQIVLDINGTSDDAKWLDCVFKKVSDRIVCLSEILFLELNKRLNISKQVFVFLMYQSSGIHSLMKKVLLSYINNEKKYKHVSWWNPDHDSKLINLQMTENEFVGSNLIFCDEPHYLDYRSKWLKG